MYSDPITPKSYPELLAKTTYDPFVVMPHALLAHPRVYADAATMEAARARLAAKAPHDSACLAMLVEKCELDKPLPPLRPPTGPADWGCGSLGPWLRLAFHNALAWSLTGHVAHRERALEALRKTAAVLPDFVDKWTGNEHHEALNAAHSYDLLAATGLDSADDALFRDLLERLVGALNRASHRYCNNHNAMHMHGKLALAASLGNLDYIHEVLYGYLDNATWRYGLIHLLRHDFLGDGLQWEGSISYHALVVLMVGEMFTVLENLGVDLWHRAWPSLRQNDGYDEHRDWGPKIKKSFQNVFEALLYSMFANGDYSLLHDQIYGNLRGTDAWWPIFYKAFTKYGDPRYAWAIRHVNGGRAPQADGPLPSWLEGDKGAVWFPKLPPIDVPEGENPLLHDRQFAPLGTHANGCSLFQQYGNVLLRTDPGKPQAPGAALYWGAHATGHRSPACLHLDVHAFGARFADAPHHYGAHYETTNFYRNWNRATIAHNTVAMDNGSMLPYDYPSDSLWEADLWRDTITDGELVSLVTGVGYHTVRARNDNVYKGVMLDRTIIITHSYLLDVFRVSGMQSHQFDWALHLQAALQMPTASKALDLGDNYGYRLFKNAQQHPQEAGWVNLPVVPHKLPGQERMVSLWLDGAPGTRLITAEDPEPDHYKPIGDRDQRRRTQALIVRAQATTTLFVSLISFKGTPALGEFVAGDANSDVRVQLSVGERRVHWLLPKNGNVKKLRR